MSNFIKTFEIVCRGAPKFDLYYEITINDKVTLKFGNVIYFDEDDRTAFISHHRTALIDRVFTIENEPREIYEKIKAEMHDQKKKWLEQWDESRN